MAGIAYKSIIVTGGGSGIGQAAAKLFAANGARVTIADIDVARGEATLATITSQGGTAQFVPTDTARADQVKALVDSAVQAFGRLDGAFNNAGVPPSGKSLHEITIEEFERVNSVNLYGTFYCLKYEIEAMLKTGGGAIVNTSSIAGLVNVPGSGDYCASKHGIAGLTKAAAGDYGTRNIRVNAIAPGSVVTAMSQRWFDDDPAAAAAYVTATHPIGRVGQPIEQAEAAMWLLSDAASFVTGIVMPVDGGATSI